MVRNIMQGSRVHNQYRLLALGVFACLVTLSGCQSESRPPASRQEVSAGSAADDDCGVVVEHTAQEAFLDLGSLLARGQKLETADFENLLAQHDYGLWVRTQESGQLNARIMQNVMTYVFADTIADKQARGRSPKRTDLVDLFTYVRDRSDSLATLMQRFETEHFSCRALEYLAGYVPSERLPDPLTVAFLTATPEIRYLEQRLLVDGSLALAAGPDQLARLMASLLYRDIAAPTGRAPHENLPGRDALIATFEKLHFESMASWLEGFADLNFDPQHPYLGKTQLHRHNIQTSAYNALTGIYKYLPSLMVDQEKLDLQGAVLDDVLRGLGAYPATGYAMARLIAEQLGEEHVRAAARSPVVFLHEYQQAAQAAVTTSSINRPVLEPFPEPAFGLLIQLLEASGDG